MTKLLFWGRVLPERAYVSLPDFTVKIRGDVNYPIDANLAVQILLSQVLVRLEGELPGLGTELIKNSIEEVVHERIDAFGYTTGRGYDLELTGAAEENGDMRVFGVEMAGLTDRDPERIDFDGLTLALSSHQPYLRLAIADLRRAIREPIDTSFYCFRAVETIRQYFCNTTDPPSDSKEGWGRLRSALRVEKEFINSRLKGPADLRRHGGFRSVMPNEREPQVLAARAIVTRFAHFLNQGCVALDEARFSLLS